jgi:type IV pilus assembly protein PilB
MRISDGELKKLLVDSGLVKEDALAEVMPKEGSSDTLQAAVLKKKLVSEKDLYKLYAQSIDIPFVELGDVKIPREILLKIPERIARKYQVILFGVEEDQMQLAMADPEDFQASDFITKQVGGKLKTYIATPGDILQAIDQYKGEISTEITKAIKDSSEDAAAEDVKVSAKDLAEDAPIAKTVNVILEYAVKSRASDIHIEPRENIVQVRYRVDGVLRETMTLPKPILAAVVSRIKILANLKIDEHRVPQDGRYAADYGRREGGNAHLGRERAGADAGGAGLHGARAGNDCAQLAQAARHDAGDRADGVGQIDHAVLGAEFAQHTGGEHLDD